MSSMDDPIQFMSSIFNTAIETSAEVAYTLLIERHVVSVIELEKKRKGITGWQVVGMSTSNVGKDAACNKIYVHCFASKITGLYHVSLDVSHVEGHRMASNSFDVSSSLFPTKQLPESLNGEQRKEVERLTIRTFDCFDISKGGADSE